MNTRNPHAELIAKAALNIKAIELKPKEPFLWASGTYNPIYNDNRMLLASFQHRMLVRDGLLKAIKDAGWMDADYICGTSLSGIAPAASVIQNLAHDGYKHHLLVLHDSELYVDTRFSSIDTFDPAEAICTTTPFAIPLGIAIANNRNLPFMYVRPKQKNHGKGKIIEGMPNTTDKTLLIVANLAEPEIYLPILAEHNIQTTTLCEYVDNLRWKAVNNPLSHAFHLTGKKVVIIEDLISTGGSALKEVLACREAGAEVLGVVSIFNYGLDSAKQAFAQSNCPVYSVLTYDILLQVAKEANMFSETELQLLADWRKDQPNWGAKNGFPPVLKK